MSDITKKYSIENALRDGTILGMLWIVTFSVSIAMLKSIGKGDALITSLATTALTCFSPILAYKLAVKHRNSECNGTISYVEAWVYIFVMYSCAILLSSIAQFIFYAYIDPHLFSGLIPEFEKFAAANGMEAGNISIFTQTFENMERMSTGSIILSQASGHFTRDIILTSILAIAVKKDS